MRELRVIEEPFEGYVLPTLPSLESSIVEAGEKWSWIDGGHFDPELLKLHAHCFRDSFNGVF